MSGDGVTVVTAFDYAGLDVETRVVVQQRTGEIKGLVRRSAQDVIEIGVKLIEVKTRIGHGGFGRWLDAEFQWSEPTAQRFMRVAERFENRQIDGFAPSALYLLASPSTPDEAVGEALSRAGAGERITHAAARGIVDGYRPAPPPARTASGLPSMSMRNPSDFGRMQIEKMPITDFELGDIIETTMAEVYGERALGKAMTYTSARESVMQRAGALWDKLAQVLAPYDLLTAKIAGAAFDQINSMMRERGMPTGIAPGSPEAKALGKEIKAATWGDRSHEKIPPSTDNQLLSVDGEVSADFADSAEEDDPIVLRTSGGLTPEQEQEFIRRYFGLSRIMDRDDPEQLMKWMIDTRSSRDDTTWRWETRSDVQVWHASNGNYWCRECDARYTRARMMKLGVQVLAEMKSAAALDPAAEPAAETITDPVKGIDLVVDGDRPLPAWVDGEADAAEVVTVRDVDLMAQAAAAPVSQREGYDSDEWYTPGWVIEAARQVMGEIDLDPASCHRAQETVQAGLFWAKVQDGIRQGWFGRVWLNPPYSAPGAFVDKLVDEYTAGNVAQACVLLNNATETKWFQRLLARFPVCFFSQRLAFWRHDHEDVGARQGQALFYLGPDVEKFVEVFGEYGIVVKRLD